MTPTPVPRVRGVAGRPVGQPPRGARSGGEDGGQADHHVRGPGQPLCPSRRPDAPPARSAHRRGGRGPEQRQGHPAGARPAYLARPGRSCGGRMGRGGVAEAVRVPRVPDPLGPAWPTLRGGEGRRGPRWQPAWEATGRLARAGWYRQGRPPASARVGARPGVAGRRRTWEGPRRAIGRYEAWPSPRSRRPESSGRTTADDGEETAPAWWFGRELLADAERSARRWKDCLGPEGAQVSAHDAKALMRGLAEVGVDFLQPRAGHLDRRLPGRPGRRPVPARGTRPLATPASGWPRLVPRLPASLTFRARATRRCWRPSGPALWLGWSARCHPPWRQGVCRASTTRWSARW